MSDRPKIDIHMPPSLVREGIEYTDRYGTPKTFNAVTLPDRCVVGGRDLGGWEFNPLFVNESRAHPDWKHIPLLADRDVWVSTSKKDADGNYIRDENGRRAKTTVKVDPQALATALEEALEGWGNRADPDGYEDDVAF